MQRQLATILCLDDKFLWVPRAYAHNTKQTLEKQGAQYVHLPMIDRDILHVDGVAHNCFYADVTARMIDRAAVPDTLLVEVAKPAERMIPMRYSRAQSRLIAEMVKHVVLARGQKTKLFAT